MRLFTAVYPSEAALESLDLALGGIGGPALGDPGPGLRWVPREQRHVTLAFHGNIADGALEDYLSELAGPLAETVPFEIALAGGGTFGGRTLWAGVGSGVEQMRALSKTSDAAAVAVGIRGDRNAGARPHLTLARASASRGDWAGRRRSERRGTSERRANSERRGTSERGGRRDASGPSWEPPTLAHLARALAVYHGPAWPVTEVCVVASRLGAGPSGGPLHEVLARIPVGVEDLGDGRSYDGVVARNPFT